jgi:hypothetical protein
MEFIQTWLDSHKGRSVQDEEIVRRVKAMEEAAKSTAAGVVGTAAERTGLLASAAPKANKTRIMKHATHL